MPVREGERRYKVPVYALAQHKVRKYPKYYISLPGSQKMSKENFYLLSLVKTMNLIQKKDGFSKRTNNHFFFQKKGRASNELKGGN